MSRFTYACIYIELPHGLLSHAENKLFMLVMLDIDYHSNVIDVNKKKRGGGAIVHFVYKKTVVFLNISSGMQTSTESMS